MSEESELKCTTKLTEEQTKILTSMLQKSYTDYHTKQGNKKEVDSEDLSDLVEYTLAMVQNSKTIPEIQVELEALISESEVQCLSQCLTAFIMGLNLGKKEAVADNNNNNNNMASTATTSTLNKTAVIKSTKTNALTSSQGLSAGRGKKDETPSGEQPSSPSHRQQHQKKQHSSTNRQQTKNEQEPKDNDHGGGAGEGGFQRKRKGRGEGKSSSARYEKKDNHRRNQKQNLKKNSRPEELQQHNTKNRRNHPTDNHKKQMIMTQKSSSNSGKQRQQEHRSIHSEAFSRLLKQKNDERGQSTTPSHQQRRLRDMNINDEENEFMKAGSAKRMRYSEVDTKVSSTFGGGRGNIGMRGRGGRGGRGRAGLGGRGFGEKIATESKHATFEKSQQEINKHANKSGDFRGAGDTDAADYNHVAFDNYHEEHQQQKWLHPHNYFAARGGRGGRGGAYRGGGRGFGGRSSTFYPGRGRGVVSSAGRGNVQAVIASKKWVKPGTMNEALSSER